MPAVILVFAIYCIRSQIKRLDQKEIKARETLIQVHTFVFVYVVLTYFAMGFIAYESWISYFSNFKIEAECRYTVAFFSCLIT